MTLLAEASTCPKHMRFGPCEGVAADGACELGDRACPFAGTTRLPDPLLRPARPGPSAAAAALLAVAARRPLVMIELPVAGVTVDAHRAAAATVAGSIDGALLGDSPWARVQLPPSLRASILLDEGVRPVPALNCRDRNRVALEGELLALDELGVAMTLCLTGDHPDLGLRPDAAAVFDLESTTLARTAAMTRMLVAVAESPSAIPTETRPLRLERKVQAGADLCFVNHTEHVDQVEEFVARVRALRVDVRLVVSVPLSVTPAGRDRIARFFPHAVPAVDRAHLGATDRASGVRAAIERAERLLAIDGVAGVDISAVPGDGEEAVTADALAEVARELGGGS